LSYRITKKKCNMRNVMEMRWLCNELFYKGRFIFMKVI